MSSKYSTCLSISDRCRCYGRTNFNIKKYHNDQYVYQFYCVYYEQYLCMYIIPGTTVLGCCCLIMVTGACALMIVEIINCSFSCLPQVQDRILQKYNVNMLVSYNTNIILLLLYILYIYCAHLNTTVIIVKIAQTIN